MYRRVFQLRSCTAVPRRAYTDRGAQGSASVPDVPGLSTAVIKPASSPVGPDVAPNKSGAYKVPEYFCYNNMSYFEAEVEMAKHRLPQPSALKK